MLGWMKTNRGVLRRSERVRRKPDWYGNNVMMGQQNVNEPMCDSNVDANLCVSSNFSDWRDRISILLSMVCLFPDNQKDILQTMLHIIAKRN